jgi:hypothetical protein
MTVNEIEYALSKARRLVFSEDESVAEEAQQEIAFLQLLLAAHPDEKARRDQLAAKKSSELLFRYE